MMKREPGRAQGEGSRSLRLATVWMVLAGTLVGRGGAGPRVQPAPGRADRAAAELVAARGPGAALRDSLLLLKLNLPSYRLDVYQGAKLTRRYRVAIGDTSYPTPVGAFEITRVEWDPWWVPPKSDWAAGDSVTPPGPRNPMGRVKLYWKDLYFLHGTPYRSSLGSPASHGCVRMRNADAIELARLVHRYGSPDVPAAEIARLAAKRGETRTIVLQRRVPLEITYDLAVVTGSRLVVYPDVYHRAGDRVAPAFTALAASGRDLATADTARVRRLIDRARGKRVAIDLRPIEP